jgi:alpha-tubulin suppressor-like RCC1 family protein
MIARAAALVRWAALIAVAGAGCDRRVLTVGYQPWPDAGGPEGGRADGETPDAGMPDAGMPDAGTPDTGVPDTGAPPPVVVSQLAAGAQHTCVLLSNGGIRCWGANTFGQLGDGTNTARPSPASADVITGAQAVATSGHHTCALLQSGGVRCWGLNSGGQLGDGTTSNRSSPGATDVLGGVRALAASSSHTCALMASAGVRCWGGNAAGQLGDGTTTTRVTPPSTDVLGDVRAVAVGNNHTCAVMNAGGVRCWGYNTTGQLGRADIETSEITSPPATDVLGAAADVDASLSHTCALLQSGGVRCWGSNGYGELGDGTRVGRTTPTPADVIVDAMAVAVGGLHTCALLRSGGVRCWGLNRYGQIGDGTSGLDADVLSPPATDVVAGAVAVSLGDLHTCALLATGRVRCWGAGATGALGNGNTTDQPLPVDVLGL